MWDLDDLVVQADIAIMFKRSKSTIANWEQRRGGTLPFPAPLRWLGGRPLYSRAAVLDWYRRRYGLPDHLLAGARREGKFFLHYYQELGKLQA